MNIVVLGATGFVGQHLLPRLAADGHQLAVLSRNVPRHRDISLIPGCRLRSVDIFDADSLSKAMSGADAAINLTGILNERGRSGAGFHRAHVDLTDFLIQACLDRNVQRILHMSALNAGKGDSFYLQSKGLAEQHLHKAAAEHGLQISIFQPSVIFGPGDGFINRFHGLLKLSPMLPLARPQAKFQPVYVKDVAEVFARSLGNPDTYGKTYPLCGPKKYTLRQLVQYVASTAGLKRRIIGLPNFASRLQAAVMDFVPGKPFSTDNYKSLLVDSICDGNGFREFGIEPKRLESVVPDYLLGSREQRRLAAARKRARR